MLQLVLTSTPYDRIPAQVAVATFFDDVRPLQGTSALVDWRLNGRLSRLILDERISGDFLETLMIPLGGRLKAQQLLLFGLGASPAWNEKRLSKLFKTIIKKSTRMNYQQIMFSLEDLAKDFMEWRNFLRELVVDLSTHAKKKDISLICRENEKWISETKRRNMDLGVDVQIEYDL